jgi:KipI family sensor histidine kinase inhibitor
MTIRIAWDGQAIPTAPPLSAQQVEARVGAVRNAVNEAWRAGRLEGVVDCLASATVVQVVCDPRSDAQLIMAAMTAIVRDCVQSDQVAVHAARDILIPVCYDPRVWSVGQHATTGNDAVRDWARDLGDVARESALPIEDLIAQHADAKYRVQFLGFAPGFAYLAGLPSRLHVPRLPSPRPMVPEGSVAIAAGQAGVYALATPGGWRVLGRTPLAMFDARRGAMLRAGDAVRFQRIGWERYVEMMG